MKLYTIGFTQKPAEEFFELLEKNNVKRIIDIRLNNKSQLTGFTKAADLKYFLKVILDIDYIYMPNFAPTKELLNDFKNKKITWKEYEQIYNSLIKEQVDYSQLDFQLFKDACLLCSEPQAIECHRRLAAEYLCKYNKDISVKHL